MSAPLVGQARHANLDRAQAIVMDLVCAHMTVYAFACKDARASTAPELLVPTKCVVDTASAPMAVACAIQASQARCVSCAAAVVLNCRVGVQGIASPPLKQQCAVAQRDALVRLARSSAVYMMPMAAHARVVGHVISSMGLAYANHLFGVRPANNPVALPIVVAMVIVSSQASVRAIMVGRAHFVSVQDVQPHSGASAQQKVGAMCGGGSVSAMTVGLEQRASSGPQLFAHLCAQAMGFAQCMVANVHLAGLVSIAASAAAQ